MRKRIILFFAVTSLILGVSGLPASAQSQMEMNAAAAASAEKADKELTAVYQKLHESLKDDAQAQQLLEIAEKSWLKYRDDEAQYEAASDMGGSIHSLAVSTVMKRLTEERTKCLAGILKDGPNIP